MSTTIQVSEKIRDQLFEIQSKLQLKFNRKVTYDEVIEYLLSVEKSKISARKEFSKKYIKSMDYDGAIGILKEGRLIENR